MTHIVKAVMVGCGGISRAWLNAIKEMDDVQMVGFVDLMEDAARRKRLGDRARAWSKIHDADWTAKQVLACYDGMISREAGGEAGS